MYIITNACRCAGLNILPAPIHFYTEAQNVTVFNNKVLQIIISYIKRRSFWIMVALNLIKGFPGISALKYIYIYIYNLPAMQRMLGM